MRDDETESSPHGSESDAGDGEGPDPQRRDRAIARRSGVPKSTDEDEDEVVDVELVEDKIRDLVAQEVRARFDYNDGSAMGLNPSQIEAIDAASPEFKEVLISSYREAMQAEIEATRAMTLLTDKDQRDGIDIVKRGLWVLVAIVLLLVGVAGIAEFFKVDEPSRC